MLFRFSNAARQRKTGIWPAVVSMTQRMTRLALIALLLTGTTATAQSSVNQVVIGNDFGGLIWNRMVRLRDLQHSGQQVTIDGAICYSTCTMYLGLSNICISPETVFGFHGPAANNRQLSENDFEYLSVLIASYYPPALRAWYLETGRYSINRVYRIQGSELIRLGLPAC